MERSVTIESSEELLLVLRHGPVGKDRAEALQDLAELYPEDLPLALVLRLFWQDPDLDVRLTAAWLLSMLGAWAPIEDLAAAFLSAAEPPDLRVRLAEMLVHLGTQPALEALAAAVHDPVIAVRAAAVNACASMSGWIPLESLTAALGDSAPQVRSAAALGLGKRLDRGLLDPDAIVVPLVGTLSDPISQVRLAVVQTFAAFGSQAPIEALLDALQDPEPEVRGAAVETLGALVEETATRPRAQTFVLEALGDSESQVRERAIEVLVAYPEYAPLAALHAATRDPHHPWKRGAAAVTLAKLGNLGPLEGALHDPDPQVRRLAAEALEIVRAAHHEQEPQDNR